MKNKVFYSLFILCLILVDQLSKVLIIHNIKLYSSVNVISGFFNLTHVRNRGAIFGFFSQSDSSVHFILLMTASLVALSLVIYFFFKTPYNETLTKIALALILSGALGNQIDRVFRGYVVDFLDFYINKWHWATFNVADMCITIGAFILVFIFIFKRSDRCTPHSSK